MPDGKTHPIIPQGFGLYVCIRVGNQDYYYGHMSQIYVSVGQTVKITDIIGLRVLPAILQAVIVIIAAVLQEQ